MCGISGIIHLDNKKAGQNDIEEMTNIIRHRGPDGFGYYLEDNIALGHARLSIIDLSEAGAQPMHYADKYVIVYNGEVYNYIEIREELITFGYKFNSSSDTEVILGAYDKWGKDCVNRFNGMWSFAIYDKVNNILFCSRDRFGVKPFYYHQEANLFVFGSEIKQLLHFLPERMVNKKNLMDYLILSLIEHNEETFFEGILKLKPSHNLILDLKTKKISIYQYYTIKIDKSLQHIQEDKAIKLYQDEFNRSINYRLRSDVKVATCLSGGLDSSSIAAVAAEFYKNTSGNKFSAITAKATEKKIDETEFAKKVVEKSNLDWYIVEPKMVDFIAIADDVIRTQEEPFSGPSIIMQYFVFQKAREVNTPVMLDGQGGDETLLGYERYYPAYLLSLPLFKRIKEFFKSSENSKLSKKQLFLYYLYFTNVSVRINRQLKRSNFIKTKYQNLISKDLIKMMSDSYLDIHKMQILEITQTQLPHLLKFEDKNSMRHSIETRLPFLDYKLLELSISLNNSLKIKKGWTKYILRKAIEDKLPESIVWRKNKVGFEAPVEEWLSDKNKYVEMINKSAILKEVFSKEYTSSNDLNLMWKLYNVARWEDIFQVKISPLK